MPRSQIAELPRCSVSRAVSGQRGLRMLPPEAAYISAGGITSPHAACILAPLAKPPEPRATKRKPVALQQNTDRIRTTHIGSLPRPHALLDMMKAKLNRQPYDEAQYQATLA